jgi:HD superfamily phosphohydrolase
MSRRLMYWQAYLHKTSLVAELMLTRIERAKN